MLIASQLPVFKAAVNGDANLAAFRAAGDQGSIAAYYNANGAGSIWRPNIASSELTTAIVWSAFMALTVQAQNGFFAMIHGGNIDATSANVRAGFTSLFGAGQTLTNLTALASRVPTRFEALFTVANVCSCFGYTVSPADVAQALAS